MAHLRCTTLTYMLQNSKSNQKLDQNYDAGIDQVMLAMKKRGFGAGKVNGTGGKQSPGESIITTAQRECQEECGLLPTNLKYRGFIDFRYQGKPEWDNRCSIFTGTQWEGELVETDEMKPEWYFIDEVPYKKMWDDDEIWLPTLLKDCTQTTKVAMNFEFTTEGKILRYEHKPQEEADQWAAQFSSL